MVTELLSLLPFYLLGCFPTGQLIARFFGVDITAAGSGNVGATNVARVIGKRAGLITLILDVFKGALAVILARLFFTQSFELPAWAGLVTVLGHCFSLSFILPEKLRGGKGVATALGVYLILAPQFALMGILTFIIVFTASKIVSLASISAAITLPLYLMLWGEGGRALLPLTLVSLIVIVRHRSNLSRLAQGKEPKFGNSGVNSKA